MEIRRPRFTARRLVAVSITLAVYLGLWFVTHVKGVPAVEAAVYSSLVASNGGPPASTVTHEGIERDPELTMADLYPNYWARARAIAPFVLVVETGVVVGPLAGNGSTRWKLWLFGVQIVLSDRSTWIS